MQIETEQNDNGNGNSGEKTRETFTFDNAYTRGITKIFKDTNSK